MPIGFEGGFGEVAGVLFGGTFDCPVDVLLIIQTNDLWRVMLSEIESK